MANRMTDVAVRACRGALVVAAFVVCVTACSSTSHTSPATTAAGARVAPYAVAGPDAVGVTELHLADGRRVAVWYPVAKGKTSGHRRDQVDLTSFLSPDLQAKVPPADRVLYPTDAYVDAPARPRAGGYPVVLFSHGFAGFPEQSVTLTTHLASWGFVVAAPDHVERSLDGLLGTAAKGVTPSTDVVVLKATLDLVERQSATAGTILHGIADPAEVAVTGHSAGASAAYLDAAADPRVKAWISYSVGFEDNTGKAQPIPAPANKPGMVMLGTRDGIIAPVNSLQVYAGMHHPKYLVSVGGAGHLVFSDLCLIGASKGGIVSIAKTLDLPIPPSLLRLASDGCGPAYPDTAKDFPAIDQLSVAFLRSVLGVDRAPVGLSTAAVAPLGGDVTVTKG